MNRQNAASCIQKIDSYMRHGISFKDALNLSITSFSGNTSFVTNEELKEKILNKPVYNNQTRGYIKFALFQLERSISKTVPRFAEGTIEHIIPQKPSAAWNTVFAGNDRELIAQKTQQFGNLTLLEYNSEASNKSYSDKKSYYSSSIYQITRNISVDEDKFDLDTVTKRNQEIAEKIIDMYEYPDVIEVVINEHNITESPEVFTGEKPSSYSCKDLGEDNVKTWVEMLISVLTNLYEYNEKTFYDLIYRNKDWALFDKKRRKAAEIGGYFIASGFSTIDILSYLKEIFEFYDAECRTTFIQDFKFICKDKTDS